MAVTGFFTAPPANSLRAAYQQTYVTIGAGAGTVPICYVDVYFNGTYYKTITSTVPYLPGVDIFLVELQDAFQEYLRSMPPLPLTPADGSTPFMTQSTTSFTSCFVKARGSSMSSTGVITPQTPVPVQATATTAAVAGGGIQSVTWYVLNASLQWKEQQDLRTYLQNLGGGQQVNGPGGNFKYGIYPLTIRKNFKVGVNDQGYLPILIDYRPFGNYAEPFTGFLSIVSNLGAQYFAGNTPLASTYFPINSAAAYYLPAAPATINKFIPQSQRIPFYGMKSYQLWIYSSFADIIYKSPTFEIVKCKRYKRVHFQNYLGHFEAINFYDYSELTTITSAIAQTPIPPLPTVAVPGNKYVRGASRTNVQSVSSGVLVGDFQESDMRLIEELQASGAAYLEYYNPEQGVINPEYLPIVIQDAEQQIVKIDERYYYEVSIAYTMANQNTHVRN